jgi:hypothetical protein
MKRIKKHTFRQDTATGLDSLVLEVIYPISNYCIIKVLLHMLYYSYDGMCTADSNNYW